MPSLDDAIATTAPDPLDAAIDGVANDKSALRESLYGAVKQNPDVAARATQLSRTTGLPAPVVARNFQEVQQRASIDAIDAAIDKGTALATKMEEQGFASLAHDDVGSLTEIERTLNRRSAGMIDGPAFVRRAELKASQGPDATFSSVLSGLFKSLPQGAELTRQGLRAQFADLFGFGDMSADAILKGQRAQNDVFLSTPQFDSATASGLYSGGSSLIRQLPGTAASILLRTPVPGLVTAGVTTEAEAYGKYRARGGPPGQAFIGAAGEGGTEVATEMLPMGFLVNKFGKAGAGEFLTGLLAREIPSEQIATLVQDAIDTAIANPDKTWGQYLAERPDAAYQTLVATLAQAGTMGAINEVGRRVAGPADAAASAEQDAQRRQEVAALAAASKLRTRDPQSFQEFVETVTPGEEVFIDARTLQQSSIDLTALAQASPSAAAQIEEALASGGDLVIPMSEYAARIAGTDLDPVLSPHLRSSEDALSLDEAQRFYQTQAAEFQKAAAKVMETKQTDDAWQQSAKAVEAALFEQLKNTGRFTDDVNNAYATLMRDFYVATASRLGITPQDMFSRYPIQVAAERAAGDAVRGQALAAQPPKGWKPAEVPDAASALWTGEESAKAVFWPDLKGKLAQDAVDLASYSHSVDKSAVEHIRKQHGDESREAARGQVAITEKDLAIVPDIVTQYDAIRTDLKGKQGQQTVAYAKRVADGVLVYLESVTHKRQNMAALTMWKYPPSADEQQVLNLATSGQTSETDGGMTESVGQYEEEFNQQPSAFRRFVQSIAQTLGIAQQRTEQPPPGLPMDMGQFFNQPTQEGNRGEIAFARDITSAPSVITLFKNADLSTFLHEAGHFQLEVLANIASQPDAPVEIVEDLNKALTWFGIKDEPPRYALLPREGRIQAAGAMLDAGASVETVREKLAKVYPDITPASIEEAIGMAQTAIAEGKTPGRTALEVWRDMSLEEKRPYHEQFARGFEAYLFEGKPPVPELQSLFRRFRDWLVRVYKTVNALNVEINDDIRGVFDRLVAVDDAIRTAEQWRGHTEQLVADSEVAALGKEATEEALDTLQTRSLRDMQWLGNTRNRLLKEMQKDAKAKRQTVEDEVKAEVRALPAYQAMRFLRTGEMTAPDGEQVKIEKGYKLDNAALAEMYPESMLARPALEKLRGVTRNDGLHPDLVAEMFGFTSGDHLVREIIHAEPEAQLIEGMTDQRVLERYGDLSSPDTLARAVDEAIHNEARARFVATELQAISKATGPVRALTKAAKDFAEAMIARKQVKDIKPNQHASAETRAAKAAEKAMRAGDTAQAATEKRNQLVQNYATRTAYAALTEIEKAVRYIGKFSSEGTRKSIDADYLDQIDALLERFDFRKSVTNKDAAKRASMLEWIESQRAQGFEPDIPPELITEALRKPYKEMTLEEMRGLVDTIKQIEHFGRLKHKLLTAADDRSYEAARDEIVTSIQTNAKTSLPEQRASDRGFLVKMSSLFRYAAAIHRKFSSLARGFDGYKDGGPAWEYLVRNMNDRGNFEAVETERATMALTKLLMPVMDKANGKLTQKDYFPTVGKSFTREERIGMLLNMGNAVNLERQLTGERLAPAQLQQIVGTLTKTDTEFVNKVWEFLDSYWPQVAEKERRVTGKTPEKVEASPFTLTLNSGEQVQMRGGYYPIAYDPIRSERSNADINAEVARQVQQGLYARAQTRRGHTKSRTESTGRPLRYDFGEVISNHVTQVIHDLAWHEYLIDANRLLRSTAIETAVREHYGVEIMQEMKDTLRDIAVGSMGAEKGATFWNHLRYGTTIAGLGFNVFNTLQNLTGITQSVSRIGAKWVFKGAARWAGDATRFESSIKKMHEMSDFMRLRAKTMQREINDIRNKVSGNDSKLTAAYFYLQAKTQLVVDTPTWWGAYEKAMSQDDMTEAKAIALADQAVIDAQGSGQTKDLAGIQRGGAGMKLFTAFYSFFNTTFNLTAEAYGRTDFKKPGDVALFAADMALLYSIPALLTTLLKAAMMGDWDDEEKLAKKIIGDQVSFALGTVVGMREAAAGVQAALGVGEGFGYTGPASVRFFADLYNLGKQVNQGEADEAFWKALNNTGGVLFHYPAGQINRTATGIAALYEGRTENPLAIVMGAPPKKQSRTLDPTAMRKNFTTSDEVSS